MNSKSLLAALVLVVLVISGAWWHTKQLKSNMLVEVDAALESYSATIVDLHSKLDQSNASDEVNKVVLDCSSEKRRQFDDRLARLNESLTSDQLNQLELLYYQCADFYAQRRATMALLLAAEIDAYKVLVGVRSSLADSSLQEQYAVRWESIVGKEQEQAKLFRELVVVQGNIISALQSGEMADSTVIRGFLADARKVQDSMGILNSEISQLRQQP